MKISVRTISLIIALSVFISVISGCNKTTPGTSNTSGSQSSATQSGITESTNESVDAGSVVSGISTGISEANSNANSTASNGTSQTVNSGTTNIEGNTYLSGFPIVKKREQIKIMIAKVPSAGNFDEMSFTKEYESLTNMDIVWQIVPQSTQFESKDTMFLSGNYPDVICLYPNTVSTSDVNKYGKEKALINIAPYLKKWAPRANAVIQTKEIMGAIKQVDGAIYTLPTLRSPEYRYWIINKKWLDNLDLAIPKTTDEFYNVLRRFKDEDPNGNGKADEIPMGAFGWNPAMWGPWGLQMRWYRFATVTTAGKVEWGPATQNFLNGAKFYRKLMNEKLFITTGSEEAHKTDLATGKVGVTLYSYIYNVMSLDLAKQYVGMAMPTANNNGNYSKTSVSEYSDGIQNKTFFITKACKNVPAALRWIDYFYTQDGYMLKTYGKLGLNYEIVNGKYRVKNATEFYLNSMKDSPSWLLGGLEKLRDGLFLTKAPTAMTPFEKAYDQFSKAAEATAALNKPARYIDMENLTFTQAELNIINTYEADLKKYIIDVGLPSVTGIMGDKVNIDVIANWNGFVQIQKDKGMDKYVAVLQAAYNRSLK